MGIARGRPGGWLIGIVCAAVLTASGLLFWLTATWLRPAQPLEKGREAYQHGRWRDALTQAEQQFKQDGNNYEALRLMARASARLQRDQMTTALYVRLGPEKVQAEDLFLLGEGLMRQGQYSEGEEMWRKALHADPAHAETLYELTQRMARTDRLAEAADLAARLGAVPGWEARAAAMRGLACLAEAEPVAAVAALQRALRLDPNVRDTGFTAPDLRRRLARALLQLHRPDEAEAELQVVLKGGPDPEAEWLASRVALQRGDRATALAAWQRATSAGTLDFTEPSPFVGSARCAECHSEINDEQQSSRHARTFHYAEQVASLKLPAQTYTEHANQRVVATVTPAATPATLSIAGGSKAMRAVMTYVLGSGRHAFTPIGRDEAGVPRELRLTYYSAISSWDRTPGHKAEPAERDMYLGERQTDDSLRRCLNCHTTNFRAAVTRTGPEAVDRGIGCERCHGPGGNHLEAVEISFLDFAIGKFRRSAGGGSAKAMAVCSECHSPQNRTFDRNDPATTVRFQALTLTWSRCFTMSRGTLDCLNCHSAHGDVNQSPSFYEAKCLACHSSETPVPKSQTLNDSSAMQLQRRVACPVNPSNNCVTCHMPKIPAMEHSLFTDHHIRVHSSEPAGNAGPLKLQHSNHEGARPPLTPTVFTAKMPVKS